MFELKNVVVNRDGRDILSIEQLQIDSNEFTVILGHNGSGKSTLAQVLAGQLKPDSGKIEFSEQLMSTLSTKLLAQKIAFLPQRLPEVAGLTVKELVRLGRFAWRGTFGRYNQQDTDIIETAMQQTDTAQFCDHIADSLSGGERQRAWIAMLLAQQSRVLILDEPTSALDVGHQYDLLSLLQSLNRESGQGVIVILHDINLALRFATRVVALKQGKISFSGDHSILFDSKKLSALYGTDITLIDHPSRDEKVAVVC
ncbi:ABC transporter ATP-binding protein [Moritella sp.]|uniref:ABC transporter ATP-binding protein n=1 Tax=Moritella sp. TaxID=78556 RepID=UPI001D7EF8DA|nr:ABC transporter ATP-binding protein [Moritella sp.]MCJ8351277.1 ABC transporter ATP-binding protein [Moritella sp.]NQZ41318.1 ABC transporter ATP-binding protein [Moritella sp.]